MKTWAQSEEGGSGKTLVFGKFGSLSCHACKDDMPNWNAAAAIIEEKFPGKVSFVKVDRWQQSDLFKRYSIKSTPKAIFLGVGADERGWIMFGGQKTTTNYVNWMTGLVNKYST